MSLDAGSPKPGMPDDPTDIPVPEDGALELTAKQTVSGQQKIQLSDLPRIIGPGVITGSADNDPAGITTYSLVGAQSGFSQNWLLLLSTPMLIAVQHMAAKIGNVTKTDFASVIRIHYGVRVATIAVLAVVIANVLTLGADLEMLASVTGMVTGVKFTYFIVPIAVLITYVSIFGDYATFSKYLLWLGAVFAAYIVAAFLSRPDWADALTSTVIPRFTPTPEYFVGAVGLLGTTITPYLFFWQSSSEVESRRGVQSMTRSSLDIAIGMIWSNVIAFFIIVTTATVLFAHQATIKTATDAAKALEPIAGPYATVLFAIGIIGAGLLAIPVLAASTAFSLGGLLGWRRSLGHEARNAPEFYLVLGLAILAGVQFAIADLDPIQMLFYSQVVNGLIAPFLIFLLLRLTTSRKVMGEFANSVVTTTIGWLTMALMCVADLALAYSLLTSQGSH